jgi:tetratricopeptide (TPR) repeat protein
VPATVTEPVEITARVRYRKFDQTYMEYIHKSVGTPIPALPVIDMARDSVTLPVAGGAPVPPQTSPVEPPWQRWNDYGIACYLEGGPGTKKGNLRQAEAAFAKLLALGAKPAEWHAHANLARVAIDLGDLKRAAAEVTAAGQCDPPAPWWLQAWLSGLALSENASSKEDWDAVAAQFAKIVDPANQPVQRNMDFTKDYVVLDKLAQAYFRRAQLEPPGSETQAGFLKQSAANYRAVLAIDPEDLLAHYGLNQCYAMLGADAPPLLGGGETPQGTVEELRLLVTLTQTGDPVARAAAAGRLSECVSLIGRKPPDPTAPRLKLLSEAAADLARVYAAEPDAPTRAAVALALSAVHRELHALYKPDDLARAAATRTYRAGHPAANAAAEAIVIYPTSRPGAPGLGTTK